MPMLDQAPVTFKGGLRDDSTGVHSFMFLLRRGVDFNQSTLTWRGLQRVNTDMAWDSHSQR